MRVLVGLLCFGGAGAAAAAKDFDDIIIREAVTLWFKDRAAADGSQRTPNSEATLEGARACAT